MFNDHISLVSSVPRNKPLLLQGTKAQEFPTCKPATFRHLALFYFTLNPCLVYLKHCAIEKWQTASQAAGTPKSFSILCCSDSRIQYWFFTLCRWQLHSNLPIFLSAELWTLLLLVHQVLSMLITEPTFCHFSFLLKWVPSSSNTWADHLFLCALFQVYWASSRGEISVFNIVKG